MLVLGEIEQIGDCASVWKSTALITQFVKVWVQKWAEWSWPGFWIVLQKPWYKVNGLTRCSMSKYFLPWKWSNLWEPVFFVLWVHSLNLLPRRGSKDLDDFYELIDSTLSREYWLSKHKLCNDAAHWPYIDSCGVVRVSKNEFWSSVVPRANIRNIWLTLNKLFGTTKITKLKDVRLGITKNVLWLDVSVAYSLGVNVGYWSH